MKEKKPMMLMTSFGPVPYEAVKEYLPKNIVEAIESFKEKVANFEDSVPMDKSYYIKSLADKRGWHVNKMVSFLNSLWEMYPASVLSLLLREIALKLDNKYPDHINNGEEFFVISMLDGRIHKIPRAHIKNFRNFAAFRTEEDAKIACRILRTELKEMFKSGQRK